jgi:hypothetical protein
VLINENVGAKIGGKRSLLKLKKRRTDHPRQNIRQTIPASYIVGKVEEKRR